jgi:hypothetical protein
MDPTKIAKWVALPGAVLAAIVVVITQYGSIQESWAQEAKQAGADTARVVVEQYAAPLLYEQRQTVELLRRSEDRDAFQMCLDYEFQDDPRDVRFEKCEDASDLRWAVWEWEDCRARLSQKEPDNCGVKPQ